MQLKVVNLNVWVGGLLLEPMVDFLLQEQADLYLLQEVYSHEDPAFSPQFRTFQVLQEVLGLPYSHFAPAFLEETGGLEFPQGNAIFSRYPLEEVSVTYYDVPFGVRRNARDAYHESPRNLQHLIAQVGSTPLHVLNTQGIWGIDGWDSPRRIQMTQHILDEIGDAHPVLLAGDFNVQPKTETIRLLESRLHNVFADELPTSFNVGRKNLEKWPGFAEAVVDMMFVSPDIQVLSHSCPNVDVSDHLPLIATLEI